jgi:hypothetical protein
MGTILGHREKMELSATGISVGNRHQIKLARSKDFRIAGKQDLGACSHAPARAAIERSSMQALARIQTIEEAQHSKRMRAGKEEFPRRGRVVNAVSSRQALWRNVGIQVNTRTLHVMPSQRNAQNNICLGWATVHY